MSQYTAEIDLRTVECEVAWCDRNFRTFPRNSTFLANMGEFLSGNIGWHPGGRNVHSHRCRNVAFPCIRRGSLTVGKVVAVSKLQHVVKMCR